MLPVALAGLGRMPMIDWLITELLSLPDLTVCPHGRPIAYKLTKTELDKQFDRIK
jgi:DNA mismatch repair ATPase MutL